MASLTTEINRRRTFAIISHPDAGKTTLTEKLLLFGGAIHVAGAVKSNKIKKYRLQLTDGTKHLLEQSSQAAEKIASWMDSGQIETLHSCEPTLETVFLEVTGRELQ